MIDVTKVRLLFGNAKQLQLRQVQTLINSHNNLKY